MSDIVASDGFVLLAGDEKPEKSSSTDWELITWICKVAAPAFPSAVVGICLGLVSSALVGHLGDRTALAAVGLSNVMTNILGYSWLWGLSGAISTLSAQDWGAENFESVGLNLQRGVLILFCFADLPLIIAWLNSESIMVMAGQLPDVAAYVGLYTRIRIPGILCETLNVSMNRTLNSMGNTHITSLVSMIVAAVNIACCFLLIPKYGFVGAPITATLCDLVGAGLTCLLGFRNADFQKCWQGLDKRAWNEWIPFLKISLPSFVLLASEAWVWNLQDFFSGWISEVAMATQAIIPLITSFLYTSGMAFSISSGSVIGNLLGEGRAKEARRAAFLSVILLQCFLIPQAALLYVLKDKVPYLFTQDQTILNSMEALLPLTLTFSCFDTEQALLTGIIGAAGKQSVAAPLIAVSYWVIGVPCGVTLAFGFAWEPLGLFGLWIGMVIGVLCHCLTFSFVVLRIDWDAVAKEVQERCRDEPAAATPQPPAIPTQPPALLRSLSTHSKTMQLRPAGRMRSKSASFIAALPPAPPPYVRSKSAA